MSKCVFVYVCVLTRPGPGDEALVEAVVSINNTESSNTPRRVCVCVCVSGIRERKRREEEQLERRRAEEGLRIQMQLRRQRANRLFRQRQLQLLEILPA